MYIIHLDILNLSLIVDLEYYKHKTRENDEKQQNPKELSKSLIITDTVKIFDKLLVFSRKYFLLDLG